MLAERKKIVENGNSNYICKWSNDKIDNREIIPKQMLQSQILTRIQDFALKIDQYYTYIINKSPFKPFFNMRYLVSLQTKKIILT